MKHQQAVDRLSEIIRDGIDALSSDIIIKIGNRYQLFETYTVKQHQDKSCTVTKKYQDPRHFFTMRAAVAWCIADKFQCYKTARNLIDLDRRCAIAKNDLEVSNSLLSRIKQSEQKQIVYSKMASKRDTLKVLEKQLTKCVNLTKYWQIKGFIQNETARPRNPKNAK